MLTPLRHRATFLLWLGQTLSAIGDHCFGMAVIWIAAREVGSGAGLVGAVQYAPALLFGLVGGAFADRWDRRRTMVWVDVMRGLVVLALPILAATQTIQAWHLALVGMALQTVTPLFDSALQASLPALAVSEQHLLATNSLMNTTKRFARLVGPLVVGFFAAVFAIEQLFSFDAITFAISAISVTAIGGAFRWKPERSKTSLTIWQDLRDGFLAVRAHPPLYWSFIGRASGAFLWALVYVVGLPLLFQREFGGDIGLLGLLISAYGFGNIISNVIIGSRPVRAPYAVMWAGETIFSLGLMLIGVTFAPWLAILFAFAAAFGGPMMDLVMALRIQLEIPNEHAGKAFALLQTWETLWFVIGLLASALLYAWLPVRAVFIIFGGLSVLVGVVGWVRWHRPTAN